MILYINSENRISGQINNATFSIPSNFISTTDDEILRLTIIDFLTYHNFYNIQSYNNSFTLVENGTTTTTITITEGSPSVYDLETDLATYLNVSSLYTYSVSYNSKKLNFDFVATPKGGGSVGSISFVFSGNSAYEALGFDNDTTNSFIAGSTTLTLSSSKIVNLAGAKALYINLLDFKNNNIYKNQKSNMLIRIPILVPSGGVIFYNNIHDDYCLDIGKNLYNLSLKITDENDNLIELQSEYSITLRVEAINIKKDNSLKEIGIKTNDYLRLILLQNSIQKT